jgi:hypothetical protein
MRGESQCPDVVDCADSDQGADRTHVRLQRSQCGWRVPEDVDALRGGLIVLLLFLMQVE